MNDDQYISDDVLYHMMIDPNITTDEQVLQYSTLNDHIRKLAMKAASVRIKQVIGRYPDCSYTKYVKIEDDEEEEYTTIRPVTASNCLWVMSINPKDYIIPKLIKKLKESKNVDAITYLMYKYPTSIAPGGWEQYQVILDFAVEHDDMKLFLFAEEGLRSNSMSWRPYKLENYNLNSIIKHGAENIFRYLVESNRLNYDYLKDEYKFEGIGNSVYIFEKLKEIGVEINVTSLTLYHGISDNNVEFIDYLLTNGYASVKDIDKSVMFPIMRSGTCDMLTMLIKNHGFDLDEEPEYYFKEAARQDNYEIMVCIADLYNIKAYHVFSNMYSYYNNMDPKHENYEFFKSYGINLKHDEMAIASMNADIVLYLAENGVSDYVQTYRYSNDDMIFYFSYEDEEKLEKANELSRKNPDWYTRDEPEENFYFMRKHR